MGDREDSIIPANTEKPPWPRSWPPFWRAVLHIAIATGIGNLGVAVAYVVIFVPVVLRWRASRLVDDVLLVSVVAAPLALSALVSALLVRPRLRELLALMSAFLIGFGAFTALIFTDHFGLPTAATVAMGTIAAASGTSHDWHSPSIAALGACGACALFTGFALHLFVHAGRRMLLALEIAVVLAALGMLLIATGPVRRVGALWPLPVTIEFGLVGCIFARTSKGVDRRRVAVACAVGVLLFSLSVAWGAAARRLGLIPDFGSGYYAYLLRSFSACVTSGALFPLTFAVMARMLIQATQERSGNW